MAKKQRKRDSAEVRNLKIQLSNAANEFLDLRQELEQTKIRCDGLVQAGRHRDNQIADQAKEIEGLRTMLKDVTKQRDDLEATVSGLRADLDGTTKQLERDAGKFNATIVRMSGDIDRQCAVIEALQQTIVEIATAR